VAAGEVQELLVLPERIPPQLEAVTVALVYILLYLVQMLPMLVVEAVLAMVAKASHPVEAVLVEVVLEVQVLEEQQARPTPAAVAAAGAIFLQVVAVAVVQE
jgi:hypothetical protein